MYRVKLLISKLSDVVSNINLGRNKVSLVMHSNIHKIEESIRRMTAVVRQNQAVQTAWSFGEDTNPETKPLGWWILACGEPLNEDSFDEREKSRERLLESVKNVGLVLPENIWIWDEAGTAQLIIRTVPTLERAKLLSRHLRDKGLTIRIRREKI